MNKVKSAILFPGQGIQVLGMGREVCDISLATQQVWDCASDVSGVDVRKLCSKGPMTKLSKTIYQQLAVTTVNAAMFTAMKEIFDFENSAFAGHSAGEYSALYAAGVFDLETLFRAIHARATIMQQLAEQQKGIMYVIKGISHYELLQRLEQQEGVSDQVSIANDNSPKQQVISGDINAVKNIVQTLSREGFELIKLPVNGAWHSQLMGMGVEPLYQALSTLPFQTPRSSIYMNREAAPVENIITIRQHLAQHLIKTVRWRETMQAFYDDGYHQFIELGSKKILGHMLSGHFQFVDAIQVTHFSDWFKSEVSMIAPQKEGELVMSSKVGA